MDKPKDVQSENTTGYSQPGLGLEGRVPGSLHRTNPETSRGWGTLACGSLAAAGADLGQTIIPGSLVAPPAVEFTPVRPGSVRRSA